MFCSSATVIESKYTFVLTIDEMKTLVSVSPSKKGIYRIILWNSVNHVKKSPAKTRPSQNTRSPSDNYISHMNNGKFNEL